MPDPSLGGGWVRSCLRPLIVGLSLAPQRRVIMNEQDSFPDWQQSGGHVIFIGPCPEMMRALADKVSARAQDLSPQAVLDRERDIAFPASVVEMLRGDLGQPTGGWPQDMQRRVLLKGDKL